MQCAFCIYLLIYILEGEVQTHQGKNVQTPVKFLVIFAFTIVTSAIHLALSSSSDSPVLKPDLGL